jgi:hypothetical protein
MANETCHCNLELVTVMWFWKKLSDNERSFSLVTEDGQGIESVRLVRCKHCGREIYEALRGWAHLDNNVTLCAPLVHEHIRAEPMST